MLTITVTFPEVSVGNLITIVSFSPTNASCAVMLNMKVETFETLMFKVLVEAS